MNRAARTGLYLLLAALPFEGMAALVVSEAALSIPLLLSGLLVALLFVEVVRRGTVTLGTVELLSLALVLPAGLSFLGAISQGVLSAEYYRSLAYAVFLPLLFVLSAQLRLSPRQAEGLVWFQVAIAVGVALVGVYQVIANNTAIPDLYFPLANPVVGLQRGGTFGQYERPASFFAEPSWFAHYAAYGTLLAAGMLVARRRRLLPLLAVAVNAAGLILAFSLGGYLVVLAALSAQVIISGPKRASLRRLLAPALVAGVALTLVVGTPLRWLVQDLAFRVNLIQNSVDLLRSAPGYVLIGQESVTDRLSLSIVGVAAWAETPMTMVFGWGVGMFHEATAALVGVPYPYSGFGWTNVLAEQGVLGLVAYLAFFLAFAKSTQHTPRRAPGYRSAATAVSLAGLLFLFVGFTGGFGFERSLILWTLLATTNVLRRSLAMGGGT